MNLQQHIQQRLDEIGLGPTQAENNGGLSKMYISDILSGKKRSINLEMLPKLAKALDVTEAEIVAWSKNQPSIATPRPTQAAFALPDTAQLPSNMPVRGVVAGSTQGAFVVDGVIDYVRRPPALMHSTNAYALYVQGTSMSPKYDPGDLVFVNPDRPAHGGDTVIIQVAEDEISDPEAWIKILVRRTEDSVIVEQLNPPKTITYPLTKVYYIHRVMKNNELFGI